MSDKDDEREEISKLIENQLLCPLCSHKLKPTSTANLFVCSTHGVVEIKLYPWRESAEGKSHER